MLECDDCMDMEDEILKLEYKIAKLEKIINELSKRIPINLEDLDEVDKANLYLKYK